MKQLSRLFDRPTTLSSVPSRRVSVRSLAHIALGCGAIALLAAGCGESERQRPIDRGAVEAEKLPSITDDELDLAQVDTASLEPDVATIPDPEPIEEATAQPVLPDGYRELVSAAKGMGGDQRDLALEALERARQLEPGSPVPDIESARVHLKANEPAAARPFIERALESDSSSSYAWNTMGRVELGEGDLAAAVASFERATQENQDNAYAWNNLGYTLLRLERLPEAAQALEQATSAANPTGYMWNNLGMVYEQMGRMDLAGAAYRRGIELGSQKSQANLERLQNDHPGETDAVESGDGLEVEADASEPAASHADAETAIE